MYLCIYRVEVELYAVWRLSAPRRRWQWRLWVQRIRVSVSAAADMLFCIPSKPKRILFRCIYVFVGTMQLYKYHQSIYSDLIGWATVWRNNGCGQKRPNGNTLNFIHLVLRTQYFLYFFFLSVYMAYAKHYKKAYSNIITITDNAVPTQCSLVFVKLELLGLLSYPGRSCLSRNICCRRASILFMPQP